MDQSWEKLPLRCSSHLFIGVKQGAITAGWGHSHDTGRGTSAISALCDITKGQTQTPSNIENSVTSSQHAHVGNTAEMNVAKIEF